MDATLELTHERVDDVPLLLAFLIRLRLPEVLDAETCDFRKPTPQPTYSLHAAGHAGGAKGSPSRTTSHSDVSARSA